MDTIYKISFNKTIFEEYNMQIKLNCYLFHWFNPEMI